MKNFKIELWDIDSIKPYPKNAKNHSDDQIERLAKVITKDGFDQPIVVDRDGVIIKGHGRRLACIKLGFKKVPVIHRTDMTPEEADAARISDNSVSSTSYDTKLLQEELKRIMASDDLTFTLDDLGLSDKERTLLIDELDIAEMDAIMNDTHAEIENQKKTDQALIDKSDKDEISIAEAFGFKKVTREDARFLNKYIAQAESEYGDDARTSFFKAIKELTSV